jgi:enamine deaminase RidA (YjgF/YER057c/UK114 family)
VRDAVGGLAAVRQVVRVRGFVCCTDDLQKIPQVVNGASDLLVAAFGQRGRHERTALGVRALPLGFAVEIDMVVQLG